VDQVQRHRVEKRPDSPRFRSSRLPTPTVPSPSTGRDIDSHHHRTEPGFTLPEVLVAIVVVGILAAVAVVGIAGVTNSGRTTACAASADAARTASVAYYTNTRGTFPTRWSNMTTAVPPVYELANGVTINRRRRRELDGQGWKLTMTGGGTTENTRSHVAERS
jgi:prepilin-type N-terminal cleavage/methylation domain-containing protein